jgi:hypothetical protein
MSLTYVLMNKGATLSGKELASLMGFKGTGGLSILIRWGYLPASMGTRRKRLLWADPQKHVSNPRCSYWRVSDVCDCFLW